VNEKDEAKKRAMAEKVYQSEWNFRNALYDAKRTSERRQIAKTATDVDIVASNIASILL
jgi:hypothetical protein